MNVKAVSDYLSINNPVLHIDTQDGAGAYLHALEDSGTVVLTIVEEKWRTEDKELEFLMNTSIEVGAYEKKGHVMPVFKIGPLNDPYLYSVPFCPTLPENQNVIDLFAEKRLIVVCFAEGKEELSFSGVRVLGIPDEVRNFFVEKWIPCLEQGEGYNLKYLNFLKNLEQNPMDAVTLWERSVYLGALEE